MPGLTSPSKCSMSPKLTVSVLLLMVNLLSCHGTRKEKSSSSSAAVNRGKLLTFANKVSKITDSLETVSSQKHRLYITDSTGKIYELSTNGKLLKTLKTSEPSFRISACKHQLFVTSRQHLIIYDRNGKVVDKLRVPGEARGVLLGMNDEFYVTLGGKKGVYTHSRRLDDDVITNEKVLQADTTTYKEISYADGLAMDTAGNLLLADHSGRVLVYSPCGKLVKTIKTTGGGAVDVEIANDGKILVAVPSASKVLLY